MKDKNLVWYLGYGSNILDERFHCYITGGQPTGSDKSYSGCRDQTLPKDNKSTTINHELYFAKESPTWKSGGVGFIRIDSNNLATTFARMYLVTKQQLENIAKQETSSTDFLTINFEEAILNGNTILKTPSWYGKLLYLGKDKDYPVFTLTNENNLTTTIKPSVEYLQTIIKGIQQTRKTSKQQIVDYLIDKEVLMEITPERNYKI